MSPELQVAIADAQAIKINSPAYNWRGFLAIGPQAVWPSDVIAKLMEEAKLALADERYARGSPDDERRALKLAAGRSQVEWAWNGGCYTRPKKPANSGRKRKAA